MRRGLSFAEAIAGLNERAEFGDRYRGEDFIGMVAHYFKERRGFELAGKVRA